MMTSKPLPAPVDSTVDLIYRWIWEANEAMSIAGVHCDTRLPDHIWAAINRSAAVTPPHPRYPSPPNPKGA
jgi:hypothetical protein